MSKKPEIFKYVDKDGKVCGWSYRDPSVPKLRGLGDIMAASGMYTKVKITLKEYKAIKLESDMETYGMSSEDPDFCSCCMGKCKEKAEAPSA